MNDIAVLTSHRPARSVKSRGRVNQKWAVDSDAETTTLAVLSYWLNAATFTNRNVRKSSLLSESDAGEAVVATSIFWIEDKAKT